MDIKWNDLEEDGMTLRRSGDCLYLTFPTLDEQPWLLNAYSTRFGGVSQGIYAAMDLSFGRGDDPENVHQNFNLFAKAVGFDPENLVCSAQTHTTNVRLVGREDRGRGYTRERGWTDVDGLITDARNVVLATFYADCVPLYFADPVHRAIGLSHSGWRGTAAKMGAVTVKAMQDAFGTKPEDLLCAIGPCICQDCYEVSAEVAHKFPNCYSKRKDDGKYLLDLPAINQGILVDTGVPMSNISMANLCTCCNPDLLFSHRATHGKRGNNAAFLMIR
ncbi:MAG: peptidoglycan editing factor PgeF [Lachnospiraceae bacterium]|nr:peptidoglycan editing factor PgeF [Lachnospiraceae bacterium]